MKQLDILRHAKSSWNNPALLDAERPLKERGVKEISVLATHIAENLSLPDYILSSDAVRCRETTDLFIEQTNYPRDQVTFLSGLYHASPQDILEIIDAYADEYDHLMIVGHNPGLTDLCNYLQSHFIENIPTTGFVRMSCDESMDQLHRDSCKIELTLTGKQLKLENKLT